MGKAKTERSRKREEVMTKEVITTSNGSLGKGATSILVTPNICQGQLVEFTPKEVDVIDESLDLPVFVRDMKEVKSDFPPIFEFNQVGDFLYGRLSGVQHNVGQHDSSLYLITLTIDGKEREISIWEKTSLSIKLAKVPMGAMVFIQLIGLRPSKKGKDWYDFRVFSSKTNK